METKEYLDKFKNHLKVVNRSASTVKSYYRHVELFLNAVSETDIRKITRKMIEQYIGTLFDYRTKEGLPYTKGTICLKVRSIKRFFEYLTENNLVFIDPSEFIKEPKLEQNLPKSTLSPAEAALVLDQPNLSTLTGIRDRAILEVFYSTGIRCNELCSLTIYSPDLPGKTLRISKGKGQKERTVPLGKHAVRFLREYVTKVRPRLTQKNRSCRHLFVNRCGEPVSRQIAGLMVRQYAKAAKIKKPVSCHTFRHTFATVLVKNGADIRAVQKMLGHMDLRTTHVYLRTLISDLKAVHKKTHPREKDRIKRGLERPDMERITASG